VRQDITLKLPSFFELLEKLPREIKDKIYFCVLYSKVSKHACESEICHFKTQKHRKQYEWIQFETRYSSKPQADGKPLRILNQDDGMDYEEGLYPKDDAAVDLGLLRNIGAGKYSLSVSSPCFLENIISCLLSLMDVEGYFLDEDDKWRNVDEERKLGLSKDLLRWFWSHVVLDLGCAWGTSRDGMRWGEQETQYVSLETETVTPVPNFIFQKQHRLFISRIKQLIFFLGQLFNSMRRPLPPHRETPSRSIFRNIRRKKERSTLHHHM